MHVCRPTRKSLANVRTILEAIVHARYTTQHSGGVIEQTLNYVRLDTERRQTSCNRASQIMQCELLDFRKVGQLAFAFRKCCEWSSGRREGNTRF